LLLLTTSSAVTKRRKEGPLGIVIASPFSFTTMSKQTGSLGQTQFR
jgi:hypothetical protein